MVKILVTGALGQIGTELVPALRARYGPDAVVASDVRMPHSGVPAGGPFEHVDVCDPQHIADAVRRHGVTRIYHLAAVLSAVAEDKPQIAWHVNMGGVYHALEVARQHRCQLFVPSSIGAFGPGTPAERTPQDTVQRPTTMYGVTKVSGELLCDYYAARFDVDTRGLRFPGLISYVAPPGGGTTDYAVEMLYHAARFDHYTCPLRGDTRLDMMYMPDALEALVQLMEADQRRLRHRNAFNVTAMQFTPEELAAEIRRHVPDFRIDYAIDPVRQAIAESWPNGLDDSAAREEWGWSPRWDLGAMVADMLTQLRDRDPSAV